MREIKFRVWTGNSMEYKIMAGYLGAFYVSGMDEKDTACMSQFNTIYRKEIPVMQFTGLLDKNGKEIWEGDILKWQSSDEDFSEYYEVVWEEKQACFATKITINKTFFAHFNTGYLEDQTPAEDLEVSGNIYENPELLSIGEKE